MESINPALQSVIAGPANQVALLKRSEVEIHVEELSATDAFGGLCEFVVAEQQFCEFVDLLALLLDILVAGGRDVVPLEGTG